MPFDPGPLADVDVVASGDRWMLKLARDFRPSPQEVWRWLTSPELLPQWAPFTADRDLGTPGTVTLHMTDGQDKDLPSVVRRAEPPDVLDYTWGDDGLVWELITTDAGTRLVLRHTVDDRTETPAYAAGWHLCLVVLERRLAGETVGPIVGAKATEYGWDELRAQYAKALGI